MDKSSWQGVLPAITTPFKTDLSLDLAFYAKHLQRFITSGCTGVVIGGSLGEGATLTFQEKETLIKAAVREKTPGFNVVLGVSSLSTAEAVEQAKMAEKAGCDGLMVLPPYVYKGDWAETKAHFDAVISATPLSCLLYNNPVAYGTDALPHQIAEVAEAHPNLHAVKESSTDVRRLAAIRAEIGNRLALAVGVDDVIVEGIAMGAVCWIAGLVNAFPEESVELFNITRDKGVEAAMPLYEWFLPLLRMDTVPKFVQLIKLVQQEVNLGSELVRPPRLELSGIERVDALGILGRALNTRPTPAGV